MKAIVGTILGLSVAAVGVGTLVLATDVIKLPIVRDLEVVMNSSYSNWQRQQLMFEAKEKCRLIEQVGAGLTTIAVNHQLENASPEQQAKAYGRLFVETKYACPQYKYLFEQAYSNSAFYVAADATETKRIYTVLGQK
jgi:hypothetical protein